MPLTPEQLAEQALDLPAESRARLADMLVESLDAADLGPLDQASAAEARRRRDEVRAGVVKTVPAQDAFKKARDSLKR
jgi:putative addiction module component (TIGR02574 family)